LDGISIDKLSKSKTKAESLPMLTQLTQLTQILRLAEGRRCLQNVRTEVRLFEKRFVVSYFYHPEICSSIVEI